jgi:hypothetical protein
LVGALLACDFLRRRLRAGLAGLGFRHSRRFVLRTSILRTGIGGGDRFDDGQVQLHRAALARRNVDFLTVAQPSAAIFPDPLQAELLARGVGCVDHAHANATLRGVLFVPA